MRIALLSAANSIHTQKIANSLCRSGHDVTLFSLPDHHDIDGGYDPAVTVQYLRMSGTVGYFANAPQLRSLLRRGSFDVLNAHYASGYGTLAGLTGFHPYVLSVWGSDVYDFPYESRVKCALLRHNLKKADALLSTSHCMARQTEKFVHGKEIAVTPFGVDIRAFCPRPKEDAPLTVGFVKGVSEKYGIRYLIEAFALVTERLPDTAIRLSVYGDGDQMPEMQETVRRRGLEDRVTFFGRIPHEAVPDALRTMDIFCVPSTLESFGVAAVEAMACGIPCVTSDAAGLSEVMADGETGFIVPRCNAEALAEKIVQLAQDPELRRKMGQQGRRRVEELYDWESNVQTIVAAYDRLLDQWKWNSSRRQ